MFTMGLKSHWYLQNGWEFFFITSKYKGFPIATVGMVLIILLFYSIL